MDPILLRLGLPGALDPSRLVLVGALILSRILPIFLLAPLFGGRLLPVVVKIASSLAFTLVLYPAIEAATPDLGSLGALPVATLFLKELVLGSALGFLASMPFFAAEAAGRLADTARGATLAEVLAPPSGTRTSPLADLALQIAVVLFFATDGHLVFLRALAASYETVPLEGFPVLVLQSGALELVVGATARLVLIALGLAAPVLCALVLADFALGFMNRVAPPMEAFFLGMPAKAVLGVCAFLLALSGFVLVLSAELGHAIRQVAQALELLRR